MEIKNICVQCSVLVCTSLGLGLAQAQENYGFSTWAEDVTATKWANGAAVAGVKGLRDTPLRYLELQTGYYTRGFSKLEHADGIGRSRHAFIGVGLNLTELLFGQRQTGESELKNSGRLVFEHIQVPHTAARSTNSF